MPETVGSSRSVLHPTTMLLPNLHHRGLQSPEVIEHMRTATARRLLARLADAVGSPLVWLRQAFGKAAGTLLLHRIVFPLDATCMAASVAVAPPHRFRAAPRRPVLLGNESGSIGSDLSGPLRYAALWRPAFKRHLLDGNHLNAHQFRQLCDRPRTVYLAFDAEKNGSANRRPVPLATLGNMA